jgi:hypothetical protein
MDLVFQLAAGDFAPPPVVEAPVQLGEGSVELALVCLSAMLADKAFDPLGVSSHKSVLLTWLRAVPDPIA